MIDLNNIRAPSAFWRKRLLIKVAQRIGEENNTKVPGGTLKMTRERIQRAEKALKVEVQIDGTLISGGVVYPNIDHPSWINYGSPILTKEEVEWMEAIMYGYGLPWGG